MLVFSAFTPHSPLLLPAIGKDHTKKCKATIAGMKKLAKKLVDSKPEVIIFLSAHPAQKDEVFSVNLSSPYHIDLKEYGDFSTERTYMPDSLFIDRLQRHARKEGINVKLDTHFGLNHGVAVPLMLLTQKLPPFRIVPISYSSRSPKDHVTFGRMIKEILMMCGQRTAIIASGDLAHTLSSDAPGGFKEEGAQFDATIKDAIEHCSTSKLLSLDPGLVEAAQECAYRPLLMLFGIIERVCVRPEIHSYEAPFGVGYLVAEFHVA